MLCLLAGGCLHSTRPIAHGPWYPIQPLVPNPVSTIPIVVADQRPEWERNFHEGPSEQQGPTKAITFVAAENVQPSPFECIENMLAHQYGALPTPPTWVECELKSFRVVVNRAPLLPGNDGKVRPMTHAERMALKREQWEEYKRCLKEYREACKKAKEDGEPVPPCPCQHYPGNAQVGAAFSSDSLQAGGMGGSVFGLGIMAATLIAKEAMHVERTLKGPPKELPDGYGASITCEIVAKVRSYRTDSQTDEWKASVRAQSPPDWLIVKDEDVSAVVEQALAEFDRQIAERVKATSSDSQ